MRPPAPARGPRPRYIPPHWTRAQWGTVKLSRKGCTCGKYLAKLVGGDVQDTLIATSCFSLLVCRRKQYSGGATLSSNHSAPKQWIHLCPMSGSGLICSRFCSCRFPLRTQLRFCAVDAWINALRKQNLNAPKALLLYTNALPKAAKYMQQQLSIRNHCRWAEEMQQQQKSNTTRDHRIGYAGTPFLVANIHRGQAKTCKQARKKTKIQGYKSPNLSVNQREHRVSPPPPPPPLLSSRRADATATEVCYTTRKHCRWTDNTQNHHKSTTPQPSDRSHGDGVLRCKHPTKQGRQ